MARQRKSTRHAPTQEHAPVRIWDKSFLAALRIHGNVTVACHVCDIDRSTAYRRREEDADFKLAWDDALEAAGDWLEHEARRRAEEGTLKPIYFKGQLVGFEQEYSDQLMALMLKGAKPDKYSEKLTIRIEPADAEVLKHFGKTAAEAFSDMIEDLRAVKLAAEIEASGNG